MIVRKMEGPHYHKKNRTALPGKGFEGSSNREKSFDQYMLEAFRGEMVQDGERFSSKLSGLAKDNLIRLSQI